MTTEKILTVVIPTYNMERYLRRCLDSFIMDEERMKKLEVLVINDGSKDSSSAIGHEYQDKYPNTYRVIDKENGNYGSCINRGLKEATGKYIKILDADDWFDNANFIEFVDTMSSLDVDLVLNEMVQIKPDGKIVNRDTFTFPKNEVFNFYPTTQKPRMHTIFYRTEIVRSVNYYQTEEISYTDAQWTFLPMTAVRKAYYIPKVLYMYFSGREGQTMKAEVRMKTLSNRYEMIKGLFDAYDRHPQKDSDVSAWFKNRLMGQINFFYFETLLNFKDEDNVCLKEFDKYFEATHPDLYNESQDSLVLTRKCPYKYVTYWRKHGKLNHCNIWLQLYLLYIKMFRKDMFT